MPDRIGSNCITEVTHSHGITHQPCIQIVVKSTAVSLFIPSTLRVTSLELKPATRSQDCKSGPYLTLPAPNSQVKKINRLEHFYCTQAYLKRSQWSVRIKWLTNSPNTEWSILASNANSCLPQVKTSVFDSREWLPGTSINPTQRPSKDS